MLAALALLGQGVIFAVAVVLARGIGIQDFRDYVVASSVFMLASSIAPLGSEKYTLRLLPVLLVREDWAHARGYLRFAVRRTLRSSILISLAIFAIVVLLDEILLASTRRAIAVAAVAVPLGALANLGLESLTAMGREFIASALFRVLAPVGALLAVVGLMAAGVKIDGTLAILVWGPAWILTVGMMWLLARRSVPLLLWQVPPIDDAGSWRGESWSFFYYRLLIGLLGQSALIVMAVLQAPAAAIGAYAAAMGVTGLCTVLATATNRVYGRKLSLLLEQQDFAGLMLVRAERLRWIVPGLTLYLVAVVFVGQDILRLFRPEFAQQGLPALHLLALGASVAVLLALAPTYLKYQKHNMATFVIMGIGVVMQVLLLVLLVPLAGATGAAIAYTLTIGSIYGAFAWMGHRELRKLQQCWRAARS